MRSLLGRAPSGLRLPMLAVFAAAFLLVPAVAAASPGIAKFTFAGEGSGKVLGAAPLPGTPEVDCSWNGEIGEDEGPFCTSTTESFEGFYGIKVIHEAAPGSEFAGWKIVKGNQFGTCSEETAETTECVVVAFSEEEEVELETTFVPCAPESEAPTCPDGVSLAVEIEGEGQVTGEGIACPGDCSESFEAGSTPGLEAEGEGGWEFTGWETIEGNAGSCEGETTPCEAGPLTEDTTLKATFEEEAPNVHIIIEGEGSGTIVGVPSFVGEPPVDCTWDGEAEAQTGDCDVLASEAGGFTGINVKHEAAPGSEFAGWTIEKGFPVEEGCEPLGATCGALILGPQTEVVIRAAFDLEPLPSFPLIATVTGQGEVTSTPAGIECTEAENGNPACEGEFEEASSVKLQAEAAPEWKFVEWTAGPCEGESSASCEFAMPAEAEEASALFEETNEVTLALIKGGHPEGGTVSSSPEGIDCGTACEIDTAGFEAGETITLTATAEPGYAFAGWLGCKYAGAGVCEVTVEAPLTEVTAVFVKDGAGGPQGPPGEDGEDGATGPQGPPGEDGEDGATGPQGPPGEDGEDGATGPQGPAGADGQNGSNGQNGAEGPQGPQGPQGAQGPRGKRGPAGKVKVICKVRGKKVRCVVKAQNKRGHRRRGKRHQRVRWALMQGGHARSHGKTSLARLQRTLNHAQPGRYVLRIQGQGGRRISLR